MIKFNKYMLITVFFHTDVTYPDIIKNDYFMSFQQKYLSYDYANDTCWINEIQ